MSFKAFVKDSYKQAFQTPSILTKSSDYDVYWKQRRGNGINRLNAYQDFRVKWIDPRVGESDTILDVGCGDGAITFALKEFKECNFLGVESCKNLVAKLENRGLKTYLRDISKSSALDDIPTVDHILMLEVLEHLPNSEEVLLRAIDKAEKSVIFSIPNTGYFPFRFRMLMGRFPVQWCTHPGEHLRFWTYRDLKWWLSELNLLDSSEVKVYLGLPFFSSVFPNLFGAGIICQIKKNK